MARKQDDNLLLDDELTAAFLGSDDSSMPEPEPVDSDDTVATAAAVAATDETWEDSENLMGQLAVDVFETENELVIKARTAGVDRNDLDVSISDGILTISGTLSSGDEGDVRNWHIQECYWGEFSRTLPLPTAVNEEGVKAELKDGVLTITFEKIKQERAKKIKVL